MFRPALVILAVAAVAGCTGPAPRGSRSGNVPTPPDESAPSTPPAPASADPAASAQPMRGVDFANRTYEWPREQVARVGEGSFTLVDGVRVGTTGPGGRPQVWSVYFNSVRFADISGDGVEEALVLLNLLPDTEVSDYGLFVFEADQRGQRQVGCLLATDRGPGAFKRMGVERGELVVELAGADQRPRRAIDPLAPREDTPGETTRARYIVKNHALTPVGAK